MNVRLRRLQADYEQIKKGLRDHPVMRIRGVSGNPPDRYQIEFRVRSLYETADGRVADRSEHVAEVYLTLAYPRQAPQCRMLTPVFHPNVAPHAICIGDHWAAGESLLNLIIRIGEMLAYQSYNTKSPLNGAAARWVDENPGLVPTDPRDLAPVAWSETRTEAVQEGQCQNCRGTAGALARCEGGHLVCPDCRVECTRCHKTYCLLCGLETCSVCERLICPSCRDVCPGCSRSLCRAHLEPCSVCGRTGCADCIIECSACRRKVCLEHVRQCAACRTPLCAEHAVGCATCSRALCADHAKPRHCQTCGAVACPECGSECAECRGYVCLHHVAQCPACKRVLCPAHGHKCARCGRTFCAADFDAERGECHACARVAKSQAAPRPPEASGPPEAPARLGPAVSTPAQAAAQAPPPAPQAAASFITARCPGCGVKLRSTVRHLGRKMACPRCGGAVVFSPEAAEPTL